MPCVYILLGNIGEVLAAYHYGILLFKQSEPTHDGEVIADGKLVQIKITQSNNIILRETQTISLSCIWIEQMERSQRYIAEPVTECGKHPDMYVR